MAPPKARPEAIERFFALRAAAAQRPDRALRTLRFGQVPEYYVMMGVLARCHERLAPGDPLATTWVEHAGSSYLLARGASGVWHFRDEVGGVRGDAYCHSLELVLPDGTTLSCEVPQDYHQDELAVAITGPSEAAIDAAAAALTDLLGQVTPANRPA